MVKLPKTLEREPLIDAVFEVRFGGNPHLTDIVPGVLFNKLSPKPTIRRLPTAEIPQPIRANDPNLMFQPVISLDLGEFAISIGDRNLFIGCKLPYPKWPRFKEKILCITDIVSQTEIAGSIERYSLKYVDLIQAQTIAEQIEKIDISVCLGGVKARNDNIFVRVHQTEGDTLHIMTVATETHFQLSDGKRISGVMVDIDSIRIIKNQDFAEFVKNLEPAVESLHQANKEKFFRCLTQATIKELEPSYD